VSRETIPHRDIDAPTEWSTPVSSGWLRGAEWRRSHDLGLAIGRVDSVDITVSGDSQTIVYVAKPPKTQNQRLAACEILLPNRRQRQQV
jgi:hypothetical protein